CVLLRFVTLVPSLSCLFFFFYCSVALPHLHSFPTRRSSDLSPPRRSGSFSVCSMTSPRPSRSGSASPRWWRASSGSRRRRRSSRSEEHTSELQSRFDLVCRLLLEKKKKTTQPNSNTRTKYPT